MGSKWAWVLMFVSVAWCLSQGCLDEERVALLQLKHFFNGGRYNYLSEWIDGDKNADCCQWERVECSNSTGRVIQLNLEYTRDENLGERYLKASLFSVFEELEWLDLWENNIAGFVENEGIDSHNKLQYLDLSGNEIEEIIFPKGLDKSSRLKNLEYLYLRGNKLNNDILLSLDALTSLKEIDLSYNSLKGTINLKGVAFQNKLQRLNLDHNEIEKVIVSKGLDSCNKLQSLSLGFNEIEKVVFHKGLNNLEILDLSYNNLDNSILLSIGALSSLKDLNLDDSGLNGIVDISEFHYLNNLEYLSMGNNKIDKFIFSKDNTSLRNLSILYLDNISIHDGNNLLQLLVSFSYLEILDLSYNNFNETTITGDFSHLKNTMNLKVLRMDHTNLNITFLQIIGLLTSASLEVLTLSNCGLQGTISHQG